MPWGESFQRVWRLEGFPFENKLYTASIFIYNALSFSWPLILGRVLFCYIFSAILFPNSAILQNSITWDKPGSWLVTNQSSTKQLPQFEPIWVWNSPVPEPCSVKWRVSNSCYNQHHSDICITDVTLSSLLLPHKHLSKNFNSIALTHSSGRALD